MALQISQKLDIKIEGNKSSVVQNVKQVAGAMMGSDLVSTIAADISKTTEAVTKSKATGEVKQSVPIFALLLMAIVPIGAGYMIMTASYVRLAVIAIIITIILGAIIYFEYIAQKERLRAAEEQRAADRLAEEKRQKELENAKKSK